MIAMMLKLIMMTIIFFLLELIPPRGGVSHLDPSSSLLSVTGMFIMAYNDEDDFNNK